MAESTMMMKKYAANTHAVNAHSALVVLDEDGWRAANYIGGYSSWSGLTLHPLAVEEGAVVAHRWDDAESMIMNEGLQDDELVLFGRPGSLGHGTFPQQIVCVTVHDLKVRLLEWEDFRLNSGTIPESVSVVGQLARRATRPVYGYGERDLIHAHLTRGEAEGAIRRDQAEIYADEEGNIVAHCTRRDYAITGNIHTSKVWNWYRLGRVSLDGSYVGLVEGHLIVVACPEQEPKKVFPEVEDSQQLEGMVRSVLLSAKAHTPEYTSISGFPWLHPLADNLFRGLLFGTSEQTFEEDWINPTLNPDKGDAEAMAKVDNVVDWGLASLNAHGVQVWINLTDPESDDPDLVRYIDTVTVSNQGVIQHDRKSC